ncbi:MAG: AAA family ATPase [Defluviitaleaceae bacterium]|nr:AAA family ATPase [Defluviitaleaceae bacterium]
MKKLSRKQIIGILCAVVALVAVVSVIVVDRGEAAEFVPYAQFAQWVDEGLVREVAIGDTLVMAFQLHSSENLYETSNPRNPALTEQLLLAGVDVVEQGAFVGITSLLPFVLLGGVFFFAFRAMSKNSGKGAMALNVTATDVSQSKIGFQSVAGNVEAKDMVSDVVDFIKNPDKYARYGARMPRGMIFYGPPGTGKTLMARAIAGEAGVPFFAVSGSDFVQMYVGVGAGRVRELFKKAREAGRAVIFIDEIDAVGKTRTSGASGGNDERDQTLNALLTEMSGFEGTEGIVVIAATNRLDTLDEALLRPGRFDRQVEIALPDLVGRESILQAHANGKPIEKSVDLARLAKQTVFFSGAMLENLLNEAAINAAKSGKETIGQAEVDKAFYTVIAGSEKADRSGIKDKERRITAYHEGGHALATKLLSPENSVAKITIIPSTKGAGGFCLNLPPDKMYYTKAELECQAISLLAGRAAEEVVFGAENVTTGASNDIQRVNALVKDYVTKYGMSNKLGLATATGEVADQICRETVNQLYEKAAELVRRHKDKLDKIADALLEKETLNEDELDLLLA